MINRDKREARREHAEDLLLGSYLAYLGNMDEIGNSFSLTENVGESRRPRNCKLNWSKEGSN